MSSENTGIAEDRVNFVLRHSLRGATSWIFTKGDGFDLGTIEDKSTRAQFDVQRVDRAIQLTEHWEDEEH